MRTDDNWQDWKFPHLLEALRKWTTRNPPKPVEERPDPSKPLKKKSYQVRQHDPRRRPCVYCESSNHQSVNCDKVTTTHERQKQLNLKQLWFNCTGTNHKASACRCSSSYKFYNRRHHSSICDKEPRQPEHMLVANGRGSVRYPAVVVSVGGIQCREVLDSGAGSSYASTALLDRLGKQLVCREFKRIEMMMQATNRETEMHNVVIESLSVNFQLKTEVTNVNRGVLPNLENPGYRDMLAKHDHLNGVTMADTVVKKELPVHLILGTSEYVQIKTETTPKIGKPGEPIAEYVHEYEYEYVHSLICS